MQRLEGTLPVVPSLYFHLIVLRHRLSLNQVLSLIQSHFD